MKTGLHSSVINNNHSLVNNAISTCNVVMEKIKQITNVPCLPFSEKIHQCLVPLIDGIRSDSKKDEDYFNHDIYPYRYHIYISIALNIIKKPDAQQLLAKLYVEKNHCIEKFLLLSGVDQGLPAKVNPDVFSQLVGLLEQGGALGKAGPPANSPFRNISRDTVLLNFFSSFIPPKVITLPAINQGVKSLFIMAISYYSPVIGGTIKAIDDFNPLTSFFPHHSVDIHRSLQQEKIRYHLRKVNLRHSIDFLKKLLYLTPSPADTDDIYQTASSSTITANSPLLVATTTAALIQQHQPYMKGLAVITALGLTGTYAAYRQFFSSYNEIHDDTVDINTFEPDDNVIRQRVSYGKKPSSFDLTQSLGGNRTCHDIISDIRALLQTEETGIRLVDSFCNYIFDRNGDINFNNAESLLKKFNIVSFSPDNRTKMSVLLTHAISVLLTPPVKKDIFNINKLIYSISEEVNQIWLRNIGKKQQETIKDALIELRQLISTRLVREFGVIDLNKTKKLSDFLLLLCSPDLIQFENHKQDHLDIVSKEVYYYWNYLGKQYSDNKYVRHDEFNIALKEGKIDGFYLRRRKFYDDVSKISPLRELFENFTSSINQEFIDYHQQDVQLERLIFLTFDDIIEAAYQEKGVNIFTPINFDIEALRVHLPPYRDAILEYLRECKNLRDVIRSFPDGMRVLWERLPNLVPQALRRYLSGETSAFVLKSYPKRDVLNEKYEKIYQKTYKEHTEIYQSVVEKAFTIMSDSEFNFIKNPFTEVKIVRLENKRIQIFRYMFMPKSFRFDANVISKVAYNERPYSEKGLIFSVAHKQTHEKRFYVINIEASRIHRQLPIIRLSLNKTEDILYLDNDFLDGHYVFHDEKTFWDPCNEEKSFKESWLSPPEKAWEFISERLYDAGTKLCKLTRPDKKIIVTFTEEKLSDLEPTIVALQKEIIKTRIAFLSYEKDKINITTATKSERDAEKGNWQLLAEKIPGYNCVELMDDLLIRHQDSTLTSALENMFQGMICASDVYLASSLIKNLKTLEYSIKKIFLQKMNKKIQLDLLRGRAATIQSLPLPAPAMKQTVADINAEISRIDDELHETYKKITITLAGLAGKPSEVIFPIFGFKNSKTFLFPWGAGIAKEQIKKLKSGLNKHTFYPWVKPHARELLENEDHILETPERMNITCQPGNYLDTNTTINIFDIHANDPQLYQKIFFATLKQPEVQVVIESAEDGGWKIFQDYDKMAMFCFISFIIPIWSYVGRIIELENYYNLNPDNTTLNAGMLFDYFGENLNQTKPLKHRLITSDQNLLIGQSFDAIHRTLKSNIHAFEFNYLFTLKHLLMSVSQELLLQRTRSAHKDRKIAHNNIMNHVKYLLDKSTLYATRTLLQDNFHSTVIDHLASYIAQEIEKKPAAMTLFSPDIDTFRHRISEFSRLHPDASLPSLAEFIRNDFRLQNDIVGIYESFSRIEYSAKVFAEYSVDEWSGENAQADWKEALQEYLSPQMQLQNIKPFLADVTQKVIIGWQREQDSAPSKGELKIIIAGAINPIFISIIKSAMRECCAIHSELLLCQYYLVDNGSWFTFLTNDFISETHHRSKRQVYSAHPFYPLPELAQKEIANAITSVRRFPHANLNGGRLYVQELNNAARSFIYFSSRPLHERLYGHLLTSPPSAELTQRDAIAIINSLLDEKGNVVGCQLKVLQRYLPADTVLDVDQILNLLSDIFRIAWPAVPDLYDFVFRQLQEVLNSPWVTLSHLTDDDFINLHSLHIFKRYELKLPINDGTIPQALQRYISAAIRHQLAFATLLIHVDPWLAGVALNDATAQRVCFGAIIAHQLKLKNVDLQVLLSLAGNAIQDAGLFPVFAQRQLALLSPPGRHDAEDALNFIAVCLEQAAIRQTQILDCIHSSQKLATFLTELTYATLTTEQHQRLLSLATLAIQTHHKLLTLTMPDHQEQLLRQAHARGELVFSWYLSSGKNQSQDMGVVGIGFDIVNKDEGLLFPYGLPLPVSGVFRHKPMTLTNDTLTMLCYAPAVKTRYTFEHRKITISSPAETQNEENVVTTFSNWLVREARRQLEQLVSAKNTAEFIANKTLAKQWLTRHLPYFRTNADLAEQLRSERIIQLAAHPDVNKWKMRQLTQPHNMTSINYVQQAISNVMGHYTDWLIPASALRSRTGVDLTLSPDKLPQNGFKGIWWDPMSDVCYLGFIKEGQKLLYASLVENREVLYSITEQSAYNPIWATLKYQNELQDSLSALQHGQLSAQSFFTQSIPAVWKNSALNSTDKWYILKNDDASQQIRQGIFSPPSFIRKSNGVNITATQLSPYTMQYHTGDIVFIFSEDNYRRISYQVIDTRGNFQTLPEEFTDWPHLINTSNHPPSEQLFNSTIETFLTLENNEDIPDYLPLLSELQQQQLASSLLSEMVLRRENLLMLSNITAGIPFRHAVDTDGLIDIDVFLKRHGRSLHSELQIRTVDEVAYSDRNWNVFFWRDKDLYDPRICNTTLFELKNKKTLFHALDALITQDSFITLHRTPALVKWVEDSITYMTRSVSAIEWFKSAKQRLAYTHEGATRIHQDRVAKNNFFRYCGEQPYVTPEFFATPWEYYFDKRRSILKYPVWQCALDQLRQLAAQMPADYHAIDTFLSLPAHLWKARKMQIYASELRRNINGTLQYWQHNHQVERMMLIRPKTPSRFQPPVSLTLSAGIGPLFDKVHAPLLLNPDQFNDLMLTDPGPTHNNRSELRLAGLQSEPRTAGDFAAWAKHRLAGPVFMNELAGPGFLIRLQRRIDTVMAIEAHLWDTEERNFYSLPSTSRFLRMVDFTAANKPRCLPLFNALFASNILVTRLIMADPEMIFGLLCDYLITSSPNRAEEDFSTAWFLFKETFDQAADGDASQSPYLIGV